MTLLRDLIRIPERVHKGDFVLRLTEGVNRPDETLDNYVVTEQLVGCFDATLDLVRNAVESKSSKAAYLHGSFGSGKSHFMAVLHLLLQANPRARNIHELAGTVERHRKWMDGRKFLLVPLHMIAARSMESAVLGGYVELVAKLHPEAPVPAVYLTDTVFANAVKFRTQVGDAKFFEMLGAGGQGGSKLRGKLSAGWDATSFDAAIKAPPMAPERARLLNDLLAQVFPAFHGIAMAGKGEAFVSFEEGLAVISAHAKALGYDALILFLDELILWLAGHMGEPTFVAHEVDKIIKLVEATKSDRPTPIVSLVARQRDLREFVGEHVAGSEQLAFADKLKFWEGRFAVVTLEDRNLPAIAEKRLLKPVSDGARLQIEDAFEQSTKVRDEILNVLLTSQADRTMFRRVYPFSPAFVQALVAVSSALQRERTALKVMIQLLVNQRDTLELGQIVPVGDLFDVIAEGDEPFGEGMRKLFESAKKLYHGKLVPLLEQKHSVTYQQVKTLPFNDPKVQSFRYDDRLLKTLLLSALVPEVETLRSMTAIKLAALNHRSIRARIPNQEGNIVLKKLQDWAAQVGEIRISEDKTNPTISLQLSDVDTDAILEKANVHSNPGNHRLKIRELVFRQLGIENVDQLFLQHKFTWRGTRREVDILFGNVRELPDESLKSQGDAWKVVIDFPFDDENYIPRHDVQRVEQFQSRASTQTVCWIPSFFSRKVLASLKKFVILEYVLGGTGERFNEYASHLPMAERSQARALLDNQRSQLRQFVLNALDMAYGVVTPSGETIDEATAPDTNFISLDRSFDPQRPAAANLADAFQRLLDQALTHQFPAHPKFEGDEEIRPTQAKKIYEEITRGLASAQGDRIEIEKPMRTLMRQVAQPLKLGTMHEAPFILEHHWEQHFERMQARDGSGWSVANLRRWMEEPKAMGLPAHLQDLVIVLFADRTNRSFFLHGSPYQPSIESLPNEVELRQQKLPPEAEWTKAVEIAAKVLGVAASPQCNASNVAKLCGDATARVAAVREPARALCKALSERMKWIDLDPSTCARQQTADAALAFVESVAAASPDTLVSVLVRAKSPTSFEAMATSLTKAQAVAQALAMTEWSIFDAAFELTDDRKPAAEVLRGRVRDALTHDELAIGIESALKSVQFEAVKLITKPVPPLPPPPPPPPSPPPAPKPGRIHDTGRKDAVSGTEALALLRELQRRIESDRSAKVTIQWDLDLEDRKR